MKDVNTDDATSRPVAPVIGKYGFNNCLPKCVNLVDVAFMAPENLTRLQMKLVELQRSTQRQLAGMMLARSGKQMPSLAGCIVITATIYGSFGSARKMCSILTDGMYSDHQEP